MVKDRFERLNKLLIVIDSFDDPEDPDILADVAISVDDMEDFLSDVEKLAVEKYGGATFEELNDEDDNDSAAGRAIALSREEAASHVVREAEEITKKALGKRGIASCSDMRNPMHFDLRRPCRSRFFALIVRPSWPFRAGRPCRSARWGTGGRSGT